jgi:membrane dipeptidase
LKDIIFDAHFDVLLDVLHFRLHGEHRVLERRYLPALNSAGVNVLICSIFIRDQFIPEGALRNALDQISALKEEIDESPEYFAICRNVKEAYKAVEGEKIAIFLSLEGAEPVENDILLLRTFYELGVRILGITWSRRNYAGDGSVFDPALAPRTAGGLTKFGRDLVIKAQKLGMVIDVSHLNDPGFYDLAELAADKPFIASHSNCRAICGHGRNLTDDQIRLIAGSGGVVGINAYAPFSADIASARSPEKLIEHIEHIIEVAGGKYVCMGLDLCDCIESLKAERKTSEERDLFSDHSDACRRFIMPVRKRFTPVTADGILGLNLLRVLEKVLR